MILPAPPAAATGPLAALARARDLAPPASLDLGFGSGGDGRYFMESGWTLPAGWGTWSTDVVSGLSLASWVALYQALARPLRPD